MLRHVALVRTDVTEQRRFLQEPQGVASQETAFFLVFIITTIIISGSAGGLRSLFSSVQLLKLVTRPSQVRYRHWTTQTSMSGLSGLGLLERATTVDVSQQWATVIGYSV
jgi:hypothetical protein